MLASLSKYINIIHHSLAFVPVKLRPKDKEKLSEALSFLYVKWKGSVTEAQGQDAKMIH